MLNNLVGRLCTAHAITPSWQPSRYELLDRGKEFAEHPLYLQLNLDTGKAFFLTVTAEQFATFRSLGLEWVELLDPRRYHL